MSLSLGHDQDDSPVQSVDRGCVQTCDVRDRMCVSPRHGVEEGGGESSGLKNRNSSLGPLFAQRYIKRGIKAPPPSRCTQLP